MTLYLKVDADDPTSREDVECTRPIVACGCETVRRSIGVGFVRRGSILIFPFYTLIHKCGSPYFRVLYSIK